LSADEYGAKLTLKIQPEKYWRSDRFVTFFTLVRYHDYPGTASATRLVLDRTLISVVNSTLSFRM